MLLYSHTLGSFAHRRDATLSRRRRHDETWDCHLGIGESGPTGAEPACSANEGRVGRYRLIQRVEETASPTRRRSTLESRSGGLRARQRLRADPGERGIGRALPTSLGDDDDCAVGGDCREAGRPCMDADAAHTIMRGYNEEASRIAAARTRDHEESLQVR